MNQCQDLLHQWCEQLLKLQIKEMNDPSLFGGILCPACGRIHGRCFDAIYPFLYLADTDQDERYLEGAIHLFEWAEYTVSRPDGSYINDSNSQWQGTTVFSVIQLVKALTRHERLLPPEIAQTWKNRILKAALFLRDYTEFEVCNINYRITNALALELCSRLFNEPGFSERGHELIYSAVSQISESGILFGEGRPIAGVSKRGCRPVDIGYNMEESLPALLEYATITGDAFLKSLALKALNHHLLFFLEDGSLDNSFGTRNYKWSYWGSRTSDGCTFACLLAAKLTDAEARDSAVSIDSSAFASAAAHNLELLSSCTQNGLLYGGLHMHEIGEAPCVHHTFCHAKVLAEILDENLDSLLAWDNSLPLPRASLKAPVHLSETDTWLIPGDGYTATVTAYDWIYGDVTGGHTSGGSISLLHHHLNGPILCASMSRYQMKEANNMQLPRFDLHQCLTPRLEYKMPDAQTLNENSLYSSLYDPDCTMTCQKKDDETQITVQGHLQNIQGEKTAPYEIIYRFAPHRVRVSVSCPEKALMVLPLISLPSEPVHTSASVVSIKKKHGFTDLTIQQGTLTLPFGQDRIYNLVPGLTALQTNIAPVNGTLSFDITFRQ